MRESRFLLVTVALVTLGLPAVGRASQQSQPGFEVVSIKRAFFPNDSFFAGYVAGGGVCTAARAEIAGNRVAFHAATLCGLIRLAYDVKDYQIAGMPGWMTRREQATFYDIDTRVETGTSPKLVDVRQMLRAMLAERFQLKVHREMREMPVYALIVDRNGPKLSEAELPCEFPRAMMWGQGRIANCAPTTSMAELAVDLSRQTDRAVVDQTGLTGKYAYSLEWAREGDQNPSAPSFFTAVREQLGLRLEPTRLPLDALVVDRAEPPSPN